MNVLIVVTHLLGTGHLSRALTLARAVQAAGDTVTVISGGMPAPHLDRGDVEIIQLPPLRSDGVNFTRLLDKQGAAASPDTLASRSGQILDVLHSHPWDAVITELFPFGRRILRAEFLTLLRAAHALPKRPVICASIRDILAPPSKPEKAVKADAIIAEFYDAVLVHSDPTVTPIDASWPVSDMLRAKLRYTGFVAPAKATDHPGLMGKGEIIVTAGGGAVGMPIFEAALRAASTSAHPWRMLIGGAQAGDVVTDLARRAPPNMQVEPARPEFRQMLNHAAACVGMCGYNTALDVLQSGCAAVFIPFDEGTEVEQTLRAQTLATLDGIAVLKSADLTPDSLRVALDAVMQAPPRAASTLAMNGAAATATILQDLHGARR